MNIIKREIYGTRKIICPCSLLKLNKIINIDESANARVDKRNNYRTLKRANLKFFETQMSNYFSQLNDKYFCKIHRILITKDESEFTMESIWVECICTLSFRFNKYMSRSHIHTFIHNICEYYANNFF